jgi:alanyl-tRNA synthetase
VLRSKPDALLEAAEKLAESEKKLRKQLETQQLKRATEQLGQLMEGIEKHPGDSVTTWGDNVKKHMGVDVTVKNIRVLAMPVDVPAENQRAAMRQMIDKLRGRMPSGVIVLGSTSDGKVALVAAVSKDLTDRLDAGKIVKAAAALVEGSGGGRKDLAEAGGRNSEKLDESLRAVPSIVEQML